MEGQPLEEGELVARARAGDGAAFGDLVQRYQDLAFRTAYLVAGDATEAEDAAQEGFVRAYRALRSFDPDRPFRPWLLEIVGNAARNRRRSAGRQAQLVLRAAGAGPGSAAEAPSPEVAVVADEQRGALLAAVNALRDEDRLAIACRFFLELSETETAAVMGCAQGTVKSRLSRALDRLRQRLAAGAEVEVARG